MHEFPDYKKNIATALENASDVDYDTAYYFVGQYDFDTSNPAIVDIVADLILLKATKGERSPYSGYTTEAQLGRLYKYPSDSSSLPASIQTRVKAREQKEQEAKEKSRVYIPYPDKEYSGSIHNNIISAMSQSTKSPAEWDEYFRKDSYSRTFRGELSTSFKQEAKTMSAGMAIFYIITLLFSLMGIFSACQDF